MGSAVQTRPGMGKIDSWSLDLARVEIADDYKRAILTIPLFHVGANKKGLYWTEKMLKEIAPMYRGVCFRYDLEGKEGSSHTTAKLSSPHYDVGWTYNDESGAWYDEKTKSLWVRGEVTHPDVIQKLARQTSDGQREVNFASMGALIESAYCSVCGTNYSDSGEPDCEHERNKPYGGCMAFKVPDKVGKALHVALTNDPADGEADIADCIFQDMSSNQNLKTSQYNASPNEMNTQAGRPEVRGNQMENGMGSGMPNTHYPGPAPSSGDILRDLAERMKTIENKMSENSPEFVNADPQHQTLQDNQGLTTQVEEKQNPEGEDNTMANDMAKKPADAQYSQEKTPQNPAPMNNEMQEAGAGSSMDRLCGLLEQLLGKMGGGMNQEMQEAGQEKPLLNASKSEAVDHHSPKVAPTEHAAPGDTVSSGAEQHESDAKNRKHQSQPGMVATADNAEPKAPAEEPEKEESAEEKKELADMRAELRAIRSKLEIQDNNVPEFGGSNSPQKGIEVADMSASQRREKFGTYGSWDACFNGAESATKFNGV